MGNTAAARRRFEQGLEACPTYTRLYYAYADMEAAMVSRRVLESCLVGFSDRRPPYGFSSLGGGRCVPFLRCRPTLYCLTICVQPWLTPPAFATLLHTIYSVFVFLHAHLTDASFM